MYESSGKATGSCSGRGDWMSSSAPGVSSSSSSNGMPSNAIVSGITMSYAGLIFSFFGGLQATHVTSTSSIYFRQVNTVNSGDYVFTRFFFCRSACLYVCAQRHDLVIIMKTSLRHPQIAYCLWRHQQQCVACNNSRERYSYSLRNAGPHRPENVGQL